ncbi:alkaline phosphatase D family protein [Nocardiopsis ansamitocini]|uniref:alkaline phosphatase D family protein n=1 Tax=Nocardiopsis ansamitocini TaxID=1670832 RepID=UPI00255220DD|nr:alkaline phosphatase D family protein [Nocardiopsis ansamitocini]
MTGVSSAAFLLGIGACPAPVSAAESLPADPFTLGVASGDPLPDGVVLWTRLAPTPLDPEGRGGMPERDFAVSYEVATDERFSTIVRRGTAVATPELGHSVHPEVKGLEPGRVYHYRFRVGKHVSRAGRTRTAPAAAIAPQKLAFASASCQAWYEGYYTAYRHMVADELDAIFFLGDYVYEYAIRAGANLKRPVALGSEHAVKVRTLAQYRLRYSLTKTDPDLQAAHAAAAWIVTWDDHEVENNYAGGVSQYKITEKEFLTQRAAAYQAFYENLPLRSVNTPNGPSARLYRTVSFGRLADIHALDTRQYRNTYPDTNASGVAQERHNPDRSILGAAQEQWLTEALHSSRANWNILANQVLMAQLDMGGADDHLYFYDRWDGFTASRDRLVAAVLDAQPPNFAVLTGDLHRSTVAELRTDYDDPDASVIGVELACTSISSGTDGAATDTLAANWLSNEHIRLYNAQRGYLRFDLDKEGLHADYRVLPYVSKENAPVSTLTRFTVPHGEPGVAQQSPLL